MDLQSETDVAAILRQWEEEHSATGYDPVPLLTRWVTISPNTFEFFY